MSKRLFTDQEIIEELSGFSRKENAILSQLYSQCIQPIRSLVLNNSGTNTDAEDVLQDAIIVFYEKIKAGEFELQSAISTYLYSVSRFIWLNKLKKNKRSVTVPDFWDNEETTNSSEDFLELYEEDKEAFINKLFDHVGPDCKKVMILSIYRNASMVEIAEIMDYKNDQIARNKKAKCLKRLRVLVQKTPRYASIIQNFLS